MIAFVVLGAVVAASLLVSYWRSRRRGGDSIVRHERALATLRDIYNDQSDDTGEHAVRSRVPESEVAASPEPTRAPPTLPRVISEARARTDLPTARRRRRPLERPQLRFGATALIGVGFAVALAAGLGGLAAWRHDGNKASGTTRTTPPASTPAATSAPNTTATTTAPTTTTAPGAAVVDRNGTPTVVVPAPFTVALAATQPSWVLVRDGTGATVFTATMSPGQTQSVPATGPVSVRLGNTHGTTVTVNGRPVDTSTLGSTVTIDFATS